MCHSALFFLRKRAGFHHFNHVHVFVYDGSELSAWNGVSLHTFSFCEKHQTGLRCCRHHTEFRNGPDLKSDDDGDGRCFGALVIPVLWIFVTPDFSWSATVMFTLVDKLTTAELFYVIKFAQTFAPPSTLLCIVFLLSTIRILAFPHKHTMCCFLRFFVTNILVVQSGDWTQGSKAVSYWEHQQI